MSIKAVSSDVAPTILEYLGGLEGADFRQLTNTWRPSDAEYRADVYRQIMMNLSYAYFVYFHADAEHPDWAPLWNPVYLMQPNPDDIYLYTPVRGDLRYRVQGNRGTCKLLTFTTARETAGLVDDLSKMTDNADFDDRDLQIGADGEFEVLVSAREPAARAGRCRERMAQGGQCIVHPLHRSWDWGHEHDPELAIDVPSIRCPPSPGSVPTRSSNASS